MKESYCCVNILFSFAAFYPPLNVSASPSYTYSSGSKVAFLSSSFYFSNTPGVQVGPLWRLSWPVKYWFFCCSNWSSDFSRHLPVELALHTVSDLGDLPGLSLSSEEWWILMTNNVVCRFEREWMFYSWEQGLTLIDSHGWVVCSIESLQWLRKDLFVWICDMFRVELGSFLGLELQDYLKCMNLALCLKAQTKVRHFFQTRAKTSQ